MAKIPFTLEAWLKDKNQKVETRDGRIVHDIWQVKNKITAKEEQAEVCALIEGEEDALLFFKNGKYLPVNAENPYDLFIITPEPEFTEFEKAVGELIKEAVHKEVGDNDVAYAIGRGWTKILLNLARKEIQDELIKFKVAAETGYNTGREDGKEEALKDLPRWKKADKDIHLIRRCLVNWDGEIDTSNFIPKDSYYIPIIELEFLPKED